ncbi:E3 ubiquitin-protein ligase BOI-like [Eucalyptus grandis]|uniref:E3 ubiquitin-protein ligase BOI-like n=1 Tax=Eucalyptus grandis TaxID=71139 RepID=UPI00192F029E|nr:E3 ubiquitin-protein ligase BOI-like [Eucalyptus grandis]
MAVEAWCADPFPAGIIPTRVFIPRTKNPRPARLRASRAEDFIPLPSSETPDPILRPSRRTLKLRIVPEFGTAKSSVKSDSGSNSDYNAAVSVPRSHHKRSRDDAIGDDQLNGGRFPANRNPRKMSRASPVLGHKAGFEIHQSEIDRLISQHTQQLARKLKEKDEEIQRIGKLNGLLQEKSKILATESYMWRRLAEDNEFEADYLRSYLQRVLSRGGAGGVDDAESHCGSNDTGTAGAECGDAAAAAAAVQGEGVGGGAAAARRLCLSAAACGPGRRRDCPACGEAVPASLQLNLSSSSS